jgi:hypothetical protein
MKQLKTKSRVRSLAAVDRGPMASSPKLSELAAPKQKRSASKRQKLPSLAELKRELAAKADTALADAQANSMRLIGRPRL